ncbi:MAG: DUF1573 domain-containing protein [Prolixibacteraceae bacterium]
MRINKIHERFFFLILPFLWINCSPPENQSKAVILFTQQEYNFGDVFFKKPVTCHFQFINLGKTALMIDNVRTTCGCTIVDWAKKPIKPGEFGMIDIKYDAISSGSFYKEIGIYYNGTDSPVILRIKGKVVFPYE